MNHSKGSLTSRHLHLNSARSSFATEDSQALSKEVELLRKLLKDAQRELFHLKQTHDQELKTLKSSFDQVKQQIQILKAEKQETLALQSYGLDEYSQLAQEVIKLRTEVDRLNFLYNKEKRKNDWASRDI